MLKTQFHDMVFELEGNEAWLRVGNFSIPLEQCMHCSLGGTPRPVSTIFDENEDPVTFYHDTGVVVDASNISYLPRQHKEPYDETSNDSASYSDRSTHRGS